MTTASPGDNETQDARKVDEALVLLQAGDVTAAEAILQQVIANCPSEYANVLEDPDGSLAIKFWDQQEFVHYVLWQKQQGTERGIRWIANAYPRAYYYMGFICVKTRQYERAVKYLDSGQKLEPMNAKFTFEKAQALVHSGKKEQALALYEEIHELGPHVSLRDIAIARRGRGFVLIELGQLDEAEEAFKSSLVCEPDNAVALNELQYIEHLRRGGGTRPMEAVPTKAPSLSECALCGKPFSKGVVVIIKGVPRSVCEKCERKKTKSWWQFWK
jgi:tetratricopeptide (TPR) repeat protein